MSKAGSVEKNEEFVKLIEKWIKIEEATIVMSEASSKKVKNPILATLIDTIWRDSEKHKQVLGLVLQHLEGTIVFTPDDMADISAFIDKHEGIEKGAIELATLALKSASNEISKFLLTYILEDEKKHDLLIDGLNKLKVRSAVS